MRKIGAFVLAFVLLTLVASFVASVVHASTAQDRQSCAIDRLEHAGRRC